MTIIVTFKFIHYLAIVFSGGVLVGGGVIQSVYARVNQIPIGQSHSLNIVASMPA